MRKYLYKEICDFNTQQAFQKVLDELSQEGWILQEFHPYGFMGSYRIHAVFYKDE